MLETKTTLRTGAIAGSEGKMRSVSNKPDSLKPPPPADWQPGSSSLPFHGTPSPTQIPCIQSTRGSRIRFATCTVVAACLQNEAARTIATVVVVL